LSKTRQSRSGGNVGGINGKAIVVEAQTKINGEAWMHLPVVLGIESEIAYRSMRIQRRSITYAATQSAVLTQDLYRKVSHLSLVRGVSIGVPEGQQMPPGMFDRPQVKGLRPLVELCVPLAAVRNSCLSSARGREPFLLSALQERRVSQDAGPKTLF
jgi:hypothetical protein